MLRFLADVCFNHHIVSGCLRKEPSLDFLSALRAGIDGVPDPDLLRFAMQEQRSLVAHDIYTMPRYFAEHLASGQTSPGVFLVRDSVPVCTAIDWLLLA
jgi:hypothetical protein